MPKNEAELKGASLVISAEVRKASGGVGLKRLATWREGESITIALDSASTAWATLEMEERAGPELQVDL
jgi:hypothetical protein